MLSVAFCRVVVITSRPIRDILKDLVTDHNSRVQLTRGERPACLSLLVLVKSTMMPFHGSDQRITRREEVLILLLATK